MSLIWKIGIGSLVFYISVSIIAKIVNKARAKKAKDIVVEQTTVEQTTVEQTTEEAKAKEE